MFLGAGRAAAQSSSTGSSPSGEEAAPVELGNKGAKPGQAEPPPEPPIIRHPRSVWAGWTFGTGYGYHAGSQLETQTFKVASGYGPGYVGHFGAELGYQYDEH